MTSSVSPQSLSAQDTGLSARIERIIESSDKVKIDDLDWDEARRVGLTELEAYFINYFADIEAQTILYMRNMLKTDVALDAEMVGFLTCWNYEEYFHAASLSRLLRECGYERSWNRVEEVRSGKWLQEVLEIAGAGILSKVFYRQYPALYMSWGAIQELTTVKAYDRLGETTKNPVLAELCARIAKQERRHFSFYYNRARDRLDASSFAQKLTRSVLEGFWTPVGSGVKPDAEVQKLFARLFPGQAAQALYDDVDGKISKLPGMEGLSVMRTYFGKRPAAQGVDMPSSEPRSGDRLAA